MLNEISTLGPEDWDKKEIKEQNKEIVRQIDELQRVLYAEGGRSLLIILQGVDAAGKDGAIRKIFSGVNPLGCNVFAFKRPTEVEVSHDFLWRIHHCTPAKGMIHIFNRSHYEDILVPKVEGYLADEVIEERFGHINNFERLVQSSGTAVLKFYLHISKEEQLDRLTERVQNPTKFWKHNDEDWDSRKKWDKYMSVYEEIFQRCNVIPWHIIPADRNWVKTNYIAREILKTLQEMNLQWPDLQSDKFK